LILRDENILDYHYRYLKVYEGNVEIILKWDKCTQMKMNSTKPVMAILT
jgi:hypothetical protein